MSRKRLFSHKIEFWTTKEQADAAGRLNDVGVMNRAGHLRRALQKYLAEIATEQADSKTLQNPIRQSGAFDHGLLINPFFDPRKLPPH